MLKVKKPEGNAVRRKLRQKRKAAIGPRFCLQCGKEIPSTARAGKKFCDNAKAMTNGQVDGPPAAVASGRVWMGMPEADRARISASVKTVLNQQIDSLATDEPAMIENLKGTGVPMVEIPQEDTTNLIAAFDKIWLPKAPVIAELCEIGAPIGKEAGLHPVTLWPRAIHALVRRGASGKRRGARSGPDDGRDRHPPPRRSCPSAAARDWRGR